ncbi:MAG: transcriptional repressor [Chloroflexi bacterium]|nr:MAG: transcriptional repressor [Chloroflexota bacterium]
MTSRLSDETLRRLQERGYRVTGPRRAVLEAAQTWDGAFTADELWSHLEQSSQPVGRATVFRTLDLLVQHGVLDRLHRPDGCHTYIVSIGSDRHHHHLICSDCGAVVQFEGCSVDAMLGELGRQTNFRISGHWLEVFGTCAACQD